MQEARAEVSDAWRFIAACRHAIDAQASAESVVLQSARNGARSSTATDAHRHTDRQTDRQTNVQTDGAIERV